MPVIPDVSPPDYSTVIGQIRLLVPDVEQLANLADPTATAAFIFTDAQIQAFASVLRPRPSLCLQLLRL
jgi:hypothetical protein